MDDGKKVTSVNKSSTSGRNFIGFMKDLKAEFGRMTWPSKESIKKSTITVFTFCLIFVVIVGLLDYGFNNVYKLIFK